MPEVATSLHLRNVHDLMLVIPIRQDFIPQSDRRLSYATRLKVLLDLLFKPSQGVAEKTLMPLQNFSDEIQNIYHFNYGVIERLQESQLVLSATFDSSWESYFHNLVDRVGPFLDALFFHCEGFKEHSCYDGYELFAEFIRKHQVQAGILYSVTPDVTVDDLRTLRRSARGERLDEPILSLDQQLLKEKAAWKTRYESDAWQGEEEYKRLRLQGIVQFFLTAWEVRKLFPSDEPFDHRNAQTVFDDAARMLTATVLKDGEFKAYALLEEEYVRKMLEGQKEFVDWLKRMLQPAGGTAPRKQCEVQTLKPENIQDDILVDCEADAGLMALLRLPVQATGQWLRDLRGYLDSSVHRDLHINVGFTYPGLRRLGLDSFSLELFPKEFQEGMEQRTGMLGDLGWPNHPDYWTARGPAGDFTMSSIDLMVVIHGKGTPSTVEAAAEKLLFDWLGDTRGECLVHTERLSRPKNDPFGFSRRKANQPSVVDELPRDDAYDNRIALGDLLLGYRDHRGEITKVTCRENKHADLFRDGTFMVVRKLAQNMAAFRRLQHEHPHLGEENTALGKPIDKDRNYTEPPESEHARISHLRRTNPRKTRFPRLVRRSFTYASGNSDNGASSPAAEQGHMFICYNASIAQQYEVIQRWINGGNSSALLSAKSDLMAGQCVSHPYPIGRDGKDPHVPNVTVRWGLYLFVPSKSALKLLASIAVPAAESGVPIPAERGHLLDAEEAHLRDLGNELIKRLEGIKDPKLATKSWQQLFEESTSARDARCVWAAIRATAAKQLPTPYGLLMGGRDDAKRVLGDDGSKYSVCRYHERFEKAGFEFYLGLDNTANSSYKKLAAANQFIQNEMSADAAYAAAHRHAKDFLNNVSTKFDLRDFGRYVIGKIAAQYVGIPSEFADKPAALSTFLDHFVNITRYSSFPHVEPRLHQEAQKSGKIITAAYSKDPSDWGGFGHKLKRDRYADGDPKKIREAVIIANVGFVPPALAMLIGMLTKWLSNGDIQHPMLMKPASAVQSIIRELKYDSTFTTIYRTDREIKDPNDPSSFVIVGAQSAYADKSPGKGNDEGNDERWMFGGKYGEATHACPMREQSLQLLAGAVVAMAEHVRAQAGKHLRLVPLGPFNYEFETPTRILPGAYASDRAVQPLPKKKVGYAIALVLALVVMAVLLTARA